VQILAVIVLAVIVTLPWRGIVAASYFLPELRNHLEHRIVKSGTAADIHCRGELLCGSSLLPAFYGKRGYHPAWIDSSGLTPQVDALIRAIRDAPLEGLTADAYHLSAIESLIGSIRDHESDFQNLERYVDLDMLLTDAFLLYAAHTLSGRVNPEEIHTRWVADTRKADLVDLLEMSLDTASIQTIFHDLAPPYEGYRRLRYALIDYRDMARRGGWDFIPGGPLMRKGDRDARVKKLRRHLMMTGDLDPVGPAVPDRFDALLERAVRKYQKRHGIAQDGIVGPDTLSRLNIPAEDLVRTIELNMERWRWLPRDLGESHILVNIAGFRLNVHEQQDSVMEMRVVVGTNYRRTPVFSGIMTYLVINPYWYVPDQIAREDMIPLIKKNPRYLEERKVRVFKSWSRQSPEIDAAAIDWKRVSAGTFPYRFIQAPGPHNPLGRIKFMFPNRFNVYLHDTPNRGLFSMPRRGFSSGCIRIEKPLELAAYLLRNDPSWTADDIEAAITSGERMSVKLQERIRVHLLYWTAWVEKDGLVCFRDDIYDRDTPLSNALGEIFPAF